MGLDVWIRRLLQTCTSIHALRSSYRVPELEPIDALLQTTDVMFSKSNFKVVEFCSVQPAYLSCQSHDWKQALEWQRSLSGTLELWHSLLGEIP